MIVLDTSGLLSALDAAQPSHAAARQALLDDPGPFLLSPFVLAELDHLIAKRNVSAELELLRDVGGGTYTLEPLSAQDVTDASRIVERYRGLNIGLAAASIVVIAARAGSKRILTLDERHFRTLRPIGGGRFTLLPADA